MAYYYDEPSRTFSEYLLIPNLTSKDCSPESVDLRTPIAKYSQDETPPLEINIPISSAIMQAVSDDRLAIALARCGGVSFIYQSQPIEEQADMVRRVKNFKAGFVVSDSNVTTNLTLSDVLTLKERTGHSTIAVTENGSPTGRLLGVVTSQDYRLTRTSLDTKVEALMTPVSQLVVGNKSSTLHDANNLIWNNKLDYLPIVDERNHLLYIVFRKDYEDHKDNPLQIQDDEKRLIVGAGINTKDYEIRVPTLVEAGVDILCVDSSDGFTQWQRDTIHFIKEKYGVSVKVGGGNIVDREGFLFLAKSGADFVKVGIGTGSICTTSQVKAIGRGQATAIREVDHARDEYYQETGTYIPICSDGGVVDDYHITLALAMGANFVMMGRYFARFDESPTPQVKLGEHYVKEYWGEGSNRAKNWQRYDLGGEDILAFEEGVDAYVPYAGALKENIESTLVRIRAAISNSGASELKEFHDKARLELVSKMSFREGNVHDIIQKTQETTVD
ncbi:IMP dehydrogenase [Chloroflexota bacterium]